MSSADDDKNREDPLRDLREEMRERHRPEPRTEVRATRLNATEAGRIDYMAEALDLDVSTLIRLILNGELSSDEDQPGIAVLLAVLERGRQLVRDFEAETQSRDCANEASRLRDEFESLCKGLL